MGLFGFKSRNTLNNKKLNDIISGNFGFLTRTVYCTQIIAIEKICRSLNCPAHFAYTASVEPKAISSYPVYTLKIVCGEINAFDSAQILCGMLLRDDDVGLSLLQKRFGLSESEAKAISGQDIAFSLSNDDDTVEFHSDDVMSYLKYADVHLHFKALGRIIHEIVPNAYVSATPDMVFVGLNMNQKGVFQDKIIL